MARCGGLGEWWQPHTQCDLLYVFKPLPHPHPHPHSAHSHTPREGRPGLWPLNVQIEAQCGWWLTVCGCPAVRAGTGRGRGEGRAGEPWRKEVVLHLKGDKAGAPGEAGLTQAGQGALHPVSLGWARRAGGSGCGVPSGCTSRFWSNSGGPHSWLPPSSPSGQRGVGSRIRPPLSPSLEGAAEQTGSDGPCPLGSPLPLAFSLLGVSFAVCPSSLGPPLLYCFLDVFSQLVRGNLRPPLGSVCTCCLSGAGPAGHWSCPTLLECFSQASHWASPFLFWQMAAPAPPEQQNRPPPAVALSSR